MMRRLTLLLMVAGSPALAASKNPFDPHFWSMTNTDFVVSIAFLLFIGLLAYLGVHKMLISQLDARAERIKADLDDAKSLREEAQALLASYERKQKDVQAQADRIVAQAKDEANAAAEQAKGDIAKSIARRLETAGEQLAAAEAAAKKSVQDQSVVAAVAAAQEVLAKQMTATKANDLIDDAIATVETKLH